MKNKRNLNHKRRDLILLFILVFFFLTFLSLNQGEYATSDLLTQRIDPSRDPIIQVGKTVTEDISEVEDNVIENDQGVLTADGTTEIDSQVEIIEPEYATKFLGTSSINSFQYKLRKEIGYKLDVDSLNADSWALSWSSGDIFVKEGESGFIEVEQSEDPSAYSDRKISEVMTFPVDTIILKASADTIIYVDLFKTEEEESANLARRSEIANKDSGAKYSSLPIISRDSWGASTNLWDPYDQTDIDDPSRFSWNPAYYRASRIVIHHTATDENLSNPASTVRSIYLYHAHTRGWGDIGYNYLIDHEGNIYEGKAGGDEVFGYHALTEANTMSIGISLLGNFDNYPPTQAQKNSLAKLIAEKSLFYEFLPTLSDGSLDDWLNPKVTIFGDKDVWFWCYSGHSYDYRCPNQDQWIDRATACPGSNLHSIFEREILPLTFTYRNAGFTDIIYAVRDVDRIMAKAPLNTDSFIVTFDLPETVEKTVIEDKIPSFSGILDYRIAKNSAIINVGDWNDGVLVPTYGWQGSPAGRFFPYSKGKHDRIRTLMKIFLLDSDVKSVGLNNSLGISPIE